MARTKGEATGVRRPGVRVGLSLDQIVAAARSLPQETVTMQAVADVLGVNRKAVSYHVSDRDRLLELVASDVLAHSLADWRLPGDADWREACRSFAVSMKDNVLATGPLIGYVRLSASDRAVLAPGEAVLERLFDAGFTEVTAAVGIGLLADIAVSFAQSAALQERSGGQHPQSVEVKRMLAEDASGLEALARIAALPRIDDDERFARHVEIFLLGMEQRRRDDLA